MSSSLRERLAREGFAVLPDALGPDEVSALLAACSRLPAHAPGEGGGGYRDLFRLLPEVVNLASHPAIRAALETVLGPEFFAVRAILFDKTPDANWKVTWHQDLTIAVQARCDVPGFGPWSMKAGIQHVQPPVVVLERMLAVRVHLDDCGADHGPMRVLAGSHRHGKLSPEEINNWKVRVTPFDCLVPVGGIVLFHPLLLHASSQATKPAHRRVIHLEFSAAELPEGLEWHERWGKTSLDEEGNEEML